MRNSATSPHHETSVFVLRPLRTWHAAVMDNLRNPPADSPWWPFAFVIGLGALQFIVSGVGHQPGSAYTEWSLPFMADSLRVSALTLIPASLWAAVIIATRLYDAVRHQPSITSDSPTYHRLYYIFKYVMLSLTYVYMTGIGLIATYYFFNKSIVGLIAITFGLALSTRLLMRHWHPDRIWKVDTAEWGGPKSYLQLGYLGAGIVPCIGGLFAMLSGADGIDLFVRLTAYVILLVLAVYGARAMVVFFLFALTHAGLIKR